MGKVVREDSPNKIYSKAIVHFKRGSLGDKLMKPWFLYISSLLHYVGLGFRQMGQRTYLMISTTDAVYSMLLGDVEKKVINVQIRFKFKF